MLELVKAGGWPMIPLLLLSLAALSIVIERFWALRKTSVLPVGLAGEVKAWAVQGKVEPNHLEALKANSPLGDLLAAVVEVRGKHHLQRSERIEDVGRHIVHRLEKFLPALGTIASIGPLLGLFGNGLQWLVPGPVRAQPNARPEACRRDPLTRAGPPTRLPALRWRREPP